MFRSEGHSATAAEPVGDSDKNNQEKAESYSH
jgi:hypothetical protein